MGTQYRNMYVSIYTYPHVATINGKSSRGLEGEQRMVYGRTWKVQRKGKILLLNYNINKENMKKK